VNAIDLAPVGGPLACLGLAFMFAGRGRELRLGGLGLLAVGSCLMAAPLVPHGHVAFVVAALVVAVLVAGGTGLLLRRWPWLVAFGTLALIPVRIPVHVGGSSSKLLLPLYVLAGGAAVQIAIETLQGDERSRELGPLAAPLAAFVLWTGLSLTWSGDVRTGDVELLAFFVPCGVIALALARLPWSRRALAWLTVELVGMALAFAAVGFWQYQTRNIFQNPKVIVGNAYAPFYRVNSVFWDPSIYGRFLVVAIIAALVVVVRGPSLRNAAIAAGAVVVCWIGLFLSYSQSSFGGLIAAVLIVAAVIWHRRAAMAIAVLAVVLLSASVASPHVRSALFKNSGNGLNESTSGRAGLVSNGIKIARQNPVFGVGVGGFKHAYADLTHLKGKEPKKAASHNTPVTVAAESGIPGLALLVWLVGAALVVTFRRLGRSFEHRAALFVGLATAAIFVHSLFYADFFEDPTTWGLLGLAALSAAALERRREERA
jgi:putative inorganic carbon (hco3(-)) transporter